jgi:hypothetical protein
LRAASITPWRKRIFSTATQQKVEREVGYAILSAEGYETNEEVVFAEPGDKSRFPALKCWATISRPLRGR